jgi:WD40 repeat protein
LVVVSGDAIVVSDLGRDHRLGRVVAEPQQVCHACTETSVTVTPDGRTVAWLRWNSTQDRQAVGVWDAVANRQLSTFAVPGANSLAFSPDGRTLVTTGPAARWDLRGRRLDPQVLPKEGPLAATSSQATFTPDGHTLVWFTEGADQQALTIRDMDSGELRLRIPGASGNLSAVSPNGLAALSREDGSIGLWDLPARRQVATLGASAVRGNRASNFVDGATFSASGGLLATLNQGTITVWDVASRTPQRQLAFGHPASLAFSPRGDLLAATAEDGSITIWEIANGERLGVLQGPIPFRNLGAVAFPLGGNALASAVPGGGLMIWNLDTPSWEALACSVARRDVSEAEWRFYAGSQPRQSTCP